jgi:hypothetical protein
MQGVSAIVLFFIEKFFLFHFGNYTPGSRTLTLNCFLILLLLLLLHSALQPLVGFRPTQLSLSILSRKVLESAVASGTSNPQLGGEPGISPQEAPSV